MEQLPNLGKIRNRIMSLYKLPVTDDDSFNYLVKRLEAVRGAVGFYSWGASWRDNAKNVLTIDTYKLNKVGEGEFTSPEMVRSVGLPLTDGASLERLDHRFNYVHQFRVYADDEPVYDDSADAEFSSAYEHPEIENAIVELLSYYRDGIFFNKMVETLLVALHSRAENDIADYIRNNGGVFYIRSAGCFGVVDGLKFGYPLDLSVAPALASELVAEVDGTKLYMLKE